MYSLDSYDMCVCENSQIESWQIQIREIEILRLIWLHIVHTIACVMLEHQFFEIETNTPNF